MAYCIGIMLDQGMIFASDSRTNAGMDNIAKFCKMKVFERRGDRVIVLPNSGNLAGTQAVIGVCRDFTHLAVAFCRCMNIPARYCTGYLGDIGTPPPYGPNALTSFRVWTDEIVAA